MMVHSRLGELTEQVALVSDGRQSAASGNVPAAIHVTPEAESGGPIAKIRDGDIIRVDAVTGTLQALVDADEWESREAEPADLSANLFGTGGELFAPFRAIAGPAKGGLAIGAAA